MAGCSAPDSRHHRPRPGVCDGSLQGHLPGTSCSSLPESARSRAEARDCKTRERTPTYGNIGDGTSVWPSVLELGTIHTDSRRCGAATGPPTLDEAPDQGMPRPLMTMPAGHRHHRGDACGQPPVIDRPASSRSARRGHRTSADQLAERCRIHLNLPPHFALDSCCYRAQNGTPACRRPGGGRPRAGSRDSSKPAPISAATARVGRFRIYARSPASRDRTCCPRST